MKPFKWQTKILLTSALLLLILLAGCQSRFGEQVPGEVVAEKTLDCAPGKFQEVANYLEALKSEPEGIIRGQFSRWEFDCGDDYIDGNWIGLQDIYKFDKAKDDDRSIGYIQEARGFSEGAKRRVGAWRGWSEVSKVGIFNGSYVGEGDFAGPMLYLRYDDARQKLEYRVVKPSGEVPDAESFIQAKLGLSAQEAGDGTLVAENEVYCFLNDIADFNYTYQVGTKIPDSGIMTREVGIAGSFRSDDPYVNGYYIQALDSLTPEDQTINDLASGFYEIVTMEGGVWKGWGQQQSPEGQVEFKGEGKYDGLRMEYDLNWEASKCKYRITELPK